MNSTTVFVEEPAGGYYAQNLLK